MSEPQSPFEKPTLDKDLDKLSFIEASTQHVLMRSAAPGLAIIFLAVAAVLSAYFVGSSSAALVIIAGAVLAAYMAMNIGANDVTNNVGAAVGAQAISLAGALTIAFVFEIAGAYLAGGRVVDTIKSGIIDGGSVADADTMMTIMLAALLSAAIWINMATWLNAPVSTTHSIVGGIMGAATAAAGAGSVDWEVLGRIVVSWVASPALGAAIAIAFLWFIKETIIYTDDKVASARRWVPPLVAVMAGSFLTYLLIVLQSRFPGVSFQHALALGIAFGALSYVWLRGHIARQSEGLENRNQSLRVLFRLPLVFSAAVLSFAHGANDVSNAIGPLAAIVEAAGIQSVAGNLDAPLWVTTIGAFGIATGLALFGPRLIRVVGSQITRLNPIRAFCVAISAAITVIIASSLGLPVSSTHIAVGAVFGVGLFREWYTTRSAKRRAYVLARSGYKQEGPDDTVARLPRSPADRPTHRYLVRRSYLASILAAWLVTVPASALVAALLVLILRPVM
jgi:PiT family inorganic phosphate transporter